MPSVTSFLDYLPCFPNETRQYAKELKKRKLDLEEVIGKGAFSTVYNAKWTTPDEGEDISVAVKVMNKEKIPIDLRKRFLGRERRISCVMSHRNIIETFMTVNVGKKLLMVMELAWGDLLKYIRTSGPCRETLGCRLFGELIDGVSYLHETADVAHRDLKLENLMLGSGGALKIADFGFATFCNEPLSCTFCGSPSYSAPEIVRGTRPYDPKKADIWSCGIILYAMLSGSIPFHDDQMRIMIRTNTATVKFSQTCQTSLSNNAINMITQILQFHPVNRPKTGSIIEKWREWYVVSKYANTNLSSSAPTATNSNCSEGPTGTKSSENDIGSKKNPHVSRVKGTRRDSIRLSVDIANTCDRNMKNRRISTELEDVQNMKIITVAQARKSSSSYKL